MISRETIRRGFPIKPLGEVAEFLDSRRRPITASERIPGPYPYYGANGQQDSVGDYIFDEPLILLAEDGGSFDQPDRGIAYAIEGKTWVNNHAHVLRPRDHARLRYLVRVLENYDVTPWITGSTRAKLTKAGAFKIQIPLPALAEQKRIAGILDAADAVRAKRREALAQLDTLIQSTFLDMFGDPVTNPKGWDVVAFESIGNSRLGKMLDKGKEVGNCQFPYLANTNVQWGRFDLAALRTMDFSESDCEEFKIEDGDLLICEGGEVGRTAIWHGAHDRIYFQKALHRVRLDPTVAVPEYVFQFMWFMAKNGGFRDLTTSATIAHLTGVKLKRLPCPRPPLELQHRFAAIVQSVEHQKASQRTHLAELDTLFASLQSRAFRGDL